jgi:hypothetical protein
VLSGSATIRFLASFGNVFLSLILGVIALGFFIVYYPDESATALRYASVAKEWIVAHAWSTRAESILRLMLEDRQLLLMTFVLALRFLLGLVVLMLVVMARRLKSFILGGAEPSEAGHSVTPRR